MIAVVEPPPCRPISVSHNHLSFEILPTPSLCSGSGFEERPYTVTPSQELDRQSPLQSRNGHPDSTSSRQISATPSGTGSRSGPHSRWLLPWWICPSVRICIWLRIWLSCLVGFLSCLDFSSPPPSSSRLNNHRLKSRPSPRSGQGNCLFKWPEMRRLQLPPRLPPQGKLITSS